jgi:hypothetical protein
MIPISCRLTEEYYKNIDRMPIEASQRKLEAKLQDNLVMMRAIKKDGSKVDIAKVSQVRIDWGMVANSEPTVHNVVMVKVTRAVMDSMGNVDFVVENTEPYIEVQTEVGFTMHVPLFESGLFRRVVAFKERG